MGSKNFAFRVELMIPNQWGVKLKWGWDFSRLGLGPPSAYYNMNELMNGSYG